MSAIHEFKCDYCNKREKAKWNGEHWLMPDGWAQLYCDKAATTLDNHACPKCLPKPKRKAIGGE